MTTTTGPTQTVEEAAEALVASRRVLTAATRRVDAAKQLLRERPETLADRTRALDEAKRDHRLAEAAHRLTLDRLRTALDAERLRTAAAVEDVEDAVRWLEEYLTSKGGSASSQAIKVAGHKAGHSDKALRMAREQLKVETTLHGFPGRTWWSLPGQWVS